MKGIYRKDVSWGLEWGLVGRGNAPKGSPQDDERTLNPDQKGSSIMVYLFYIVKFLRWFTPLCITNRLIL